jgi:hypothetical protein
MPLKILACSPCLFIIDTNTLAFATWKSKESNRTKEQEMLSYVYIYKLDILLEVDSSLTTRIICFS